MTARTTTSPASSEERVADLLLRAVELRAMAWWLFDTEIAGHRGKHGQIAAQLLDFADLLEVVERDGWWSR